MRHQASGSPVTNVAQLFRNVATRLSTYLNRSTGEYRLIGEHRLVDVLMAFDKLHATERTIVWTTTRTPLRDQIQAHTCVCRVSRCSAACQQSTHGDRPEYRGCSNQLGYRWLFPSSSQHWISLRRRQAKNSLDLATSNAAHGTLGTFPGCMSC